MRTLIEISKSGLRASQRSLSVTSNNIINADTPGYTRQRVEKAPVGMQMSTYNTGLGVNITSIKRMRNEMNDLLLNEKRQDMSFMSNKARVFEQLESAVATDSGNDLDMSISQILDNFSELATDPQDLSVRNNLISEARQMTGKFRSISATLDRNSELTRESAVQTVGKVNEILSEIYTLNQTVAQGEASGQPDLAGKDLRVQKMEELSELINFETQEGKNDVFEIRVNGVLILDDEKLQVLKPEVDQINEEFRVRLDNGKLIDVEGGRLGAEADIYQNEIPGLRDRLDRLANTMVTEINNIHRQGYGLSDDTQRDFFDPSGTTADSISLNAIIAENPEFIAASSADGEAGNGVIASQIADLREAALIDGRKPVDYAVSLISSPGTELSSLRSNMDAREAEINMLVNQQEREAGVNVDEELSLMIQYQNAYQGAAKVMSAAQTMYDTLLGIIR